MDDKKLFLLDAFGLIYRAYYALIRSPRKTSKGLNTSAIFGFCNTLDELLRKEDPDYIAVCFDPPHGLTFRHEEYPGYKAQREAQPEDITLSIPYIKEILAAYNIPVIEMERYEADDVIGTLARRAAADGYTAYMMTLDKDMGQLVGDRIYMYRPSLRGQGFEVRGPREVCERYGIQHPIQVIDVLALEGDTSDNIPGCPGVGEKTAAKLISEWGSVENLIDHIDDLKGALQKKIADNAQQIKFSKYLATIKTDVPIDIRWEELRRSEPDVERLVKVFNELEFRSFIARLNARAIIDNKDVPAPPSLGGLFDQHPEDTEFPLMASQAVTSQCPSAAMLETPSQVAQWVKSAIAAKEVGLSVFALGEDAMTAKLRGIGLAYNDGTQQRIAYMPMSESLFGMQESLTMLEPLMTNPAVTLVSHDVKRDMVILRVEGLEIKAKYYDTAVAHYLLKPEMKHGFDYAAYDVLGYKSRCYEMTDPQRRKAANTVDHLTADRVGERAAMALTMMPVLKQALQGQGLTPLMEQIELPLVRVLASMEWEGARIDVAELAKLSVSLTQRLEDVERQAYELAGERFNIGSPAQVGEILFGKMRIDPKAKKTKSGTWSTTEDILEKYRREYPLVDAILKARQLRKLLATYVDALPKLINPVDGKLHTLYNQTVTATGRISSTNPNLQNIPIRTDDGREIRRAFIPDPGDLLLSADYSQIELRLIADFSGDEGMIEAFNSGQDIHRSTAAKIYHIPLDQVTDNQRRNAKTANFGIIYGISPFGLSGRLEIPRNEAKMLIDGYLATYPQVKKYMDDSIAHARELGYVTTVKGRKRYLPDINSRNSVVRGYAERNAINAPLQGSAADIIKIAMIRIYDEIERRGWRSRMILQVHDELIFNVKPDELAQLQQVVIREMTHAYEGRVPLEVSAGVGFNWLEAH